MLHAPAGALQEPLCGHEKSGGIAAAAQISVFSLSCKRPLLRRLRIKKSANVTFCINCYIAAPADPMLTYYPTYFLLNQYISIIFLTLCVIITKSCTLRLIALF
jgi:hypothetical protein